MKTIEAEAGENIWSFTKRAKDFIILNNLDYGMCKFNNVMFTIYSNSRQEDSVEIYGLRQEIKRMAYG